MSYKIPFTLLCQSQGHVVVIETITRVIYHGKLVLVEPTMNCELQCVSVKYQNGTTAQMECTFIRGSKIVFLVLPSVFQDHLVFGTKKSLGPISVEPPEPKKKTKKRKSGKGKNAQTKPKNVKETPEGPSTSNNKLHITLVRE